MIISLLSLYAMADDTASLQATLDGGNVTLLSGHTYNISSPGVIVKGIVNGNNAIINYTSTTGSAVRLSTSSASFSNATVQGVWNYLASAGDASGSIGVRLLNNNQTLNNVRILKFAAYGLLSGPYSNLSITNNTISQTGYIGFFYSADAVGTGNNSFTGNTVDRSMLPPSTVQQLAVGIRGSTSVAADTTTNWTISGNTFKMPLNPSSVAAECIEVRYMVNSLIYGNTCINGSIGISVVRSKNVLVKSNTTSGSRDEGIEFASSTYCSTYRNNITSSNSLGIFLDGYSPSPAFPGCDNITLRGDAIRNTASDAVQSYITNTNIYIDSLDIQTKGKGINLLTTSPVTITDTKIDGLSISGTTAIFVDKGSANVVVNRGSIVNCTRMIFVYDNRLNQLVDNIVFTNVLQPGTMTQISSSLSNGAHLGSNVHFLTKATLVFASLPTKTYGASNFDPGAVSSNAVFYSSSNTSVATIVSGNIHIVASGSCNIQASNGDTSIIRTLTVLKAPLSVYADNKSKRRGSVNPTLTVHYSGFVPGDNAGTLTTQPTVTTTAVTNSPVGHYDITASGAVSNKYSFTYFKGILSVSTGRQTKARFGGIIRTP